MISRKKGAKRPRPSGRSGTQNRKTVAKSFAALPSWWAAVEAAARADGVPRAAYIQRAVTAYTQGELRLNPELFAQIDAVRGRASRTTLIGLWIAEGLLTAEGKGKT